MQAQATTTDEPDVTHIRHHLPALPRSHVPRLHLYRQLDAAADSAVSLLVAPVGAGKTLGVAGWLRRPGSGYDALWVDAGPGLGVPELDALVARTGPHRALLVLDDAHLLAPAAVRHLDRLLRDEPRTLHVMLLSRWDLSLTRLVPELLGDLKVVRGDAFRLDDRETTQLVSHHARTTSPVVADAVRSLTQGWCAAAVLTATSVGAARDVEAAAVSLRAEASGGADRVANESFAALTAPQRHVLLCVAGEASVTAEDARHLSHDPMAGQVLGELEQAGLLVTRHGDGTYRIHPLLAEVIRRRVVAGGVDVARARATVLRAVEVDLARGEPAVSFRRLVSLGEDERAAFVLEHHGLTLVLGGQGDAVGGFVRTHPETIESHPGTWMTVAVERWSKGDTKSARHWLDRLHADELVSGHGYDAGRTAAWVRLLRSRLGLESVADAALNGECLLTTRDGSTPMDALLMLEVGVAHNWLGRLADAEVELSAAAAAGRAGDLDELTAAALSHMAVNQYMRGREHTSAYLADQAAALAATSTGHPASTLERCAVVQELVSIGTIGERRRDDVTGARRPDGHGADTTTDFWRAVLDAGRQLAAGLLADAGAALDILLTRVDLPSHLRTVALVERSLLAALASAPQVLSETGRALVGLGAEAEAALAAALRANLVGDGAAADSLFGEAERSLLAQPPVSEIASVCRAQLLDARGDTEEAMTMVAGAVTATEVRRTALPFLGWSRTGTPVHSLLQRQPSLGSPGWARDLAQALGSGPGLAADLGTVTATPHEQAHAGAAPVTAPLLSPRERGVLNELARGATYADIAENLVVSANTVKTHVSSLYRKLGVSRRSEALAVARTTRLL